MSDLEVPAIPIHPVAPRMKNGAKTPHVGPDIEAYQKAHAATIGEESDEWWANVRSIPDLIAMLSINRFHSDRSSNPALGSPFPHCKSWRVRDRGHRLVS